MTSPSAEVLNAAVDISLALGRDWLQPIGPRLLGRYPHLLPAEVEPICRQVEHIRRVALDIFGQEQRADISSAEAKAQVHMLFPALTTQTVARLRNQGFYYAWHG